MSEGLRQMLEGYDSDAYLSGPPDAPRIHKLYRKLSRKNLSRYHALQNSLALPQDRYHEIDLGHPTGVGVSPTFRMIRFRVL